MSNQEICPKCSARFEARDALVYGGVPLYFGFITAPGVSTRIRCPNCGYKFSALHLKFFGFMSVNALRWALLVAFAGGVLLVVLSSSL